MHEKKVRKVVILALAGMLIGSLLFIFGASIQETTGPMIVNYIIALLLYISSFLAVYNNHKVDKEALYKYLMCIDIGLIILVSFVAISNIL